MRPPAPDAPSPAPLPLERRWELFLRHRQMLTDYLRCLLRDQPEAEDLFQEVGLVVMRHPTGPEAEDRFPAWCRGIARNLAHERWRARRREVGGDEVWALIERAYEEADQEADAWARRRAALGHCLAALPRPDRDLLRRRYAAGASADALGKAQGASAEAIRMKIMRLRKALARCIERRLASQGAQGA